MRPSTDMNKPTIWDGKIATRLKMHVDDVYPRVYCTTISSLARNRRWNMDSSQDVDEIDLGWPYEAQKFGRLGPRMS